MELNSTPPMISATMTTTVSSTAQRVLRSAAGLPWSNTCGGGRLREGA